MGVMFIGGLVEICFSLSEIDWALTKDFVSILGTFGALLIGAIGLSTWRRQLKGSHSFDLAKRTYHLIKKYRALIKELRTVAYRNHETLRNQSTRKLSQFEEQRNAYNYRWKNVANIRQLLDSELLECEFAWDDYPNDTFDKLFEFEIKLSSCTRLHIEHLDPDSSDDIRKDARENRDTSILYETNGQDEFSKELDNVIKGLKSYFRGK